MCESINVTESAIEHLNTRFACQERVSVSFSFDPPIKYSANVFPEKKVSTSEEEGETDSFPAAQPTYSLVPSPWMVIDVSVSEMGPCTW